MDRIAGSVVIWVAVLALRDVTRPFRALNLVPGFLLLAAPWLVPNTRALTVSTVLAGCTIIALSLPRGQIHQQTGGGWRAILQPERLSLPPAH